MATEMEDLALLRNAESICDEIWEVVSQWDEFTRNTIGQQLVRAADSIGANIAESYGRYNYGEKIQFLYYSRGSLYETKYWLRRTLPRRLLVKHQVEQYADQLDTIAKQLNIFIKSLRSQKYVGGKSAT